MKKLICKIFGHRWGSNKDLTTVWEMQNKRKLKLNKISTTTILGYKCFRCGKIKDL